MIGNTHIEIADLAYYHFDADLDIFRIYTDDSKKGLVNVFDKHTIIVPTDNNSNFFEDIGRHYYTDPDAVIEMNNDTFSAAGIDATGIKASVH